MAELVTGEAVAVEIKVARLASRACALLLDLMIQLVILNFALVLANLTTMVADDAWQAGLIILMTVLIQVGYPCAFETLSRGRTLGKLALGLRVVSDDGGPIRFRQALVRALAGYLEFWVLFGAPALLASLFSKRGKRLGDLFAGTVVIQERASGTSIYGPIAVMPPHLAGWAQTLELSQLSDELAMTARQYLARFWDLLPEVRDALGQRITDQVTAVVSPPAPPGVRPEILLSAILAERRRRDEWRLAERKARRMRIAGQHQTPWTGQAAPAPAMAMAGAAPVPAPPQGPPAPPPFSDPVPGRPAFLPPTNYGSGPYQDVLTQPRPGAGPNAWGTGQYPSGAGAHQPGAGPYPPGASPYPPGASPQPPPYPHPYGSGQQGWQAPYPPQGPPQDGAPPREGPPSTG
ncbi:RDD family protein [Spirillospora sp. NPDC048911]|uniref:RDD family protein n=1 Tax=Spirillospora sp. NPDC048911 TaxID=3364527 RepID=UPI0037220F1A